MVSFTAKIVLINQWEKLLF